jgi:hypothetical protein
MYDTYGYPDKIIEYDYEYAARISPFLVKDSWKTDFLNLGT